MMQIRDREGVVHTLPHQAAAAQKWPGMHVVPSVADPSVFVVLNRQELAVWSQAVASQGRNLEMLRKLQIEARRTIHDGGKARVESTARTGPWPVMTGSALDRLAELGGQVSRMATDAANLPADAMAAWRREVDANVRTLGNLARDGARAGYEEWAASVAELSTAYSEALEKAAEAMKNAAGDLGEGFGDFFKNLLGIEPGLLLLLVGGGILAFYAFTPGGLALIGVGGKAVAGAVGAGKAIGVAGVQAVPGAFQAAASFIPGNAAAAAVASA